MNYFFNHKISALVKICIIINASSNLEKAHGDLKKFILMILLDLFLQIPNKQYLKFCL